VRSWRVVFSTRTSGVPALRLRGHAAGHGDPAAGVRRSACGRCTVGRLGPSNLACSPIHPIKPLGHSSNTGAPTAGIDAAVALFSPVDDADFPVRTSARSAWPSSFENLTELER
jgi:hypothetical protein